MTLLSIFRGTQAECSARPVSDGTLLFATDTKKIYLDKDSSRIEMSSVDDLSGYVTKEQLTTALNGKQDKLNRSSGVTVGRLAVQGSNESANTSEYLATSGSARGAMTIGGILPESSRDGALSIAAFNHGANAFTCAEDSDKATFSIAEDGWIKNDQYILGILSKYSTTEDFAVSLLKEMFTGAAIITNESQDFVGFVKSVDSVDRATLTLSVTMDRKLTGKSTPAQHQYLLRNRGNCNLTMYSQATSDYGFAIGGPNNVITGRCSGAIGTTSFITGQNSTAIGSENIVSENFLHAMLIGDTNFSVGKEKLKDGTKLYSGRSYAFGNQNTVRRSFVVAVGFGLLVYEDGDAAEFDSSGNLRLSPVVVTGRYNSKDVKKNHPNATFIVGNGMSSSSRSDGLVVNSDGTVEMDSLVLVKQDGTKVKLTADALEKVVSGDCYTKAEVDALVKSLADRVAALEKVKFQTKSVTPSTSAQTITADSGYDALSSVSVAAIPYTETENSAGGKTVTIAGSARGVSRDN